ncbi:site-2 protease family protein [Candidatus Uhrbacteria bacterium]|nr:site-2 protease family protein [Candidatus Uhrbacteria bacterium]
MIGLLFSEPTLFLVIILAIIFALSFHEFAHAWAGHMQGDTTAERAGRLTLNPLSHIDWVGLLLLVTVGFGWGKPVPFNPHNLRNKKWGPVIVALAGPTSNLLLALVFTGIFHLLNAYAGLPATNALIVFVVFSVIINIALMLFNLMPIPPLDGSRLLNIIFEAPKYAQFRWRMETQGVWVLLFVIMLDAIFNIGIFAGLFSFVTNFSCGVLLGGAACI